MALVRERYPARRHLGTDARELHRPGVLDRYGERDTTAGRRVQPAAQRARRRPVRLGADRQLRRLSARHLLLRRRPMTPKVSLPRRLAALAGGGLAGYVVQRMLYMI